MKVAIFGATGMVGQGVLRECLIDSTVTGVLTVGRRATGASNPRLKEIVHSDLLNLDPVAGELTDLDACFFCLGITSVGLDEADYTRITYDITMAVAGTLARTSPQLTFVFTSGVGADSSEKGSVMWARVKGKAENGILGLPFKGSYVFRPGVIQPLHGIRSRTGWYNALYVVLKPAMSLARSLAPKHILTTEQIGRAMIRVAQRGAPKRVLEPPDIYALATEL
jgi:uncharacterized protein YbjT (DUF2867 family)